MQIIRHLFNSILAVLLLVSFVVAPQTAGAYKNLSIEGRTSFSSLTLTGPVTGDLDPSVDNTYDVGSTALRWKSGYFGTSLASPAISVTSTGAGITLYNTTDQVTNYERGVLNFQSNVLTLDTEASGTGNTRSIRIGDGSSADVLLQTSSFPHVLLRRGGSTNAASTSDGVVEIRTGSLTAASSKQMVFRIEPTFAQSGTAAYTVLDIDSTESSTGSGEKLFVDFKVGGTSQFKIDNAGYLYAGGSYGSLAEGDGYYFGDTVRGWRYLTGDDIELRQWHVGGQIYQSSYNGSVTTRYVVHDAATKRSAFSSTVDLRNYTPNTDLEVIGTASATNIIVGRGTAATGSISFSGDPNTGLYSDNSDVIGLLAGSKAVIFSSSDSALRPSIGDSNALDLGMSSRVWRDAYFGGTVSSTNVIASGVVTSSRMEILSTAPTSTVQIGSTTKKSCLVLGDIDGAGLTYVTALNGVLTASVTPCNP